MFTRTLYETANHARTTDEKDAVFDLALTMLPKVKEMYKTCLPAVEGWLSNALRTPLCQNRRVPVHGHKLMQVVAEVDAMGYHDAAELLQSYHDTDMVV